PRTTAVHAALSSGSVKVRMDDKPIRALTSDVQWETPGAMRDPDRYELTVYSGCVRVTMDTAAPAGAPVPQSTPTGAGAAPIWRADEGVSLILDGIEKRLSESRAG
ncbi:MAG TPA: hypothetical protein VIJ03_11665, partial [Candidatus Dormibacteraeota bacterium]